METKTGSASVFASLYFEIASLYFPKARFKSPSAIFIRALHTFDSFEPRHFAQAASRTSWALCRANNASLSKTSAAPPLQFRGSKPGDSETAASRSPTAPSMAPSAAIFFGGVLHNSSMALISLEEEIESQTFCFQAVELGQLPTRACRHWVISWRVKKSSIFPLAERPGTLSPFGRTKPERRLKASKIRAMKIFGDSTASARTRGPRTKNGKVRPIRTAGSRR